MTTDTNTTPVASPILPGEQPAYASGFTWDRWVEQTGVPIHRGYYVPDLRTLELGWWEERKVKTSFVQLMGQEGVCETRVVEIVPGESLEASYLGVDELVYVLRGRGAASVWEEGARSLRFEWQQNSLFSLPRNTWRKFFNTSGTDSIRLLHYNYLPLAMSVIPDPDFFFRDNHVSSLTLERRGEANYAPAQMLQQPSDAVPMPAGVTTFWFGNFMPDMRLWDGLTSNAMRGAGSRAVFIQFPDSEMTVHMSVFPARTYKKAHRHGPGRAIVIPSGEGYSVMWEEGKEKVVVPWHEGSMITPPNRWFHQHFNAGGEPARYMALHPPRQFSGYSEKIEDRARDQIEYPDEAPEIRERFKRELAQRGLTSLIPEEVYTDRDYVWSTKK